MFIYCYSDEISLLFVVGNAAFHSRVLYPNLVSCLSALCQLLRDSDEKTRANAAGAIGNLVRNSGELDKTLAAMKIPQLMMSLVVEDRDITTQRIALFSLGTMAVYAQCRDSIMTAASPSLVDIFHYLQEVHTKDDVMVKYASRLKQKLKAAVQVGSAQMPSSPTR